MAVLGGHRLEESSKGDWKEHPSGPYQKENLPLVRMQGKLGEFLEREVGPQGNQWWGARFPARDSHFLNYQGEVRRDCVAGRPYL